MELVICVKGEFNALIGGDKIILHAGDIAVADSYDVHSYKADKAALTADWWVGDVDRTVELAFAPNKYNAENTSVKSSRTRPKS